MSQLFAKFLNNFFKLSLGGLAIYSTLGSSPVTAQTTAPQSYIGLGGAIGLGGNTTSLGTGGLTVLTKVGFTENLSLHDATVLFGDGAATSMIILTADFPIRNAAGQIVISPFIGGGALLRYREGLLISPALSGGLDLPISPKLTGTIRLNAGFPNDRPADLGVLVGVGYNIGS